MLPISCYTLYKKSSDFQCVVLKMFQLIISHPAFANNIERIPDRSLSNNVVIVVEMALHERIHCKIGFASNCANFVKFT